LTSGAVAWLNGALRHAAVGQFVRFATVGVVGTAAHYSVLTALVELAGVAVLPATTAGFLVGALVNYALNRRFTFASSARHVVALPKFLLIVAIGALLNAAIVAVLLPRVPVHYLVIQLAATGVVLLWNFIGNYLWTFRR
jgi:putative flippase GtrA